MADLIDRAAAIAEVTKRHWPQAVEAAKAIAALPAQGVRVKPEVREAIAAICAEDDPFIGIGKSAYDKADRILAAIEPAEQPVATSEAGGVDGNVDAKAALEEMANLQQPMSLEDWSRLSARILAGLNDTPAPVDALVKAAEVRGIRMALRAGLSAVANAPPNTPERDISLAVFQSISALIGEKP